MAEKTFGVVESTRQVPVVRLVDESEEMVAIRKAIDSQGLDPIWGTLIAQFGAAMYRFGRLSLSPLRPVRHGPQHSDELETPSP